MNKEVMDKLRGLSPMDFNITKFVSTGSYALNKIISGDYQGGIPIGGILQLKGRSSTGKTLFATSILSQAQKKGYYTKMLDAENTLSVSFAEMLGLDTKNLLYSNPETLEDAFDDVKKTIEDIRLLDKETPIVIVIDSVAVLTTKDEVDEDAKKEKKKGFFDQSQTDGAVRAKCFGNCLRRINPIVKNNNVALVVINQIRSKIGVIYGNPDVVASGGNALEYFLSVDLEIKSNKTSDVLRDDDKNPIGIEGEVECKKNKVSIPFKSCDFKVEFNKGLVPYVGLLPHLIKDKLIQETSPGRYFVGDLKFTEKQFEGLLLDQKVKELDSVRVKLGISNKS